MKIWLALVLINVVIGDQKILSRKKRIDEVNEDYDEKADEHEQEKRPTYISYF